MDECNLFQSTLPSQGATSIISCILLISIFQSTLPSQGATDIYIRLCNDYEFQSTLPSQGATATGFYFWKAKAEFQSTLPSQGATRVDLCYKILSFYFNPRSPHRERLASCRRAKRYRNFNPRSPHRERLLADPVFSAMLSISIHAPLTGSDLTYSCRYSTPLYFNPRSPHRERQQIYT